MNQIERTRTRAKELRRFDTMLALPLGRFRRALTHLTSDELAVLATRIDVQMIRHRWGRGGHGIERLRARHELGLLERRLTALRREREARQMALPAPVSLTDYAARVPEPGSAEVRDRAA